MEKRLIMAALVPYGVESRAEARSIKVLLHNKIPIHAPCRLCFRTELFKGTFTAATHKAAVPQDALTEVEVHRESQFSKGKTGDLATVNWKDYKMKFSSRGGRESLKT